MIVAGPGTGKTKTLTARIAHLLNSGVQPAEIVALTFTKKAAKELQARVAATVPGQELPRITTFHGLCYELVPSSAEFIDQPARLALIKRLKTQAAFKKMSARELGLAISRAKNRPVGEEVTEAEVAALVEDYNAALRDQNLRDFDDLLIDAHQALRANTFSLPFRHILVDEFQDTNALQYQLLQLLDVTSNVTAIGDPQQSIYGFRGASGDIFATFQRDFPRAKTVTLTHNYRSVPEVVRMANAVFTDAADLLPTIQTAGRARAVQVLNEYGEAHWIVNEIEKRLGGTDFLRSHEVGESNELCRFQDFAVLYRSHFAARTMQRVLAESGIPYQVAGEGSPFEQPAVQQIIAVLRYLYADDPLEPPDELAAEQFAAKKSLPLSKLVPEIIAAFGLDDENLTQFTNGLLRFDYAGAAAFLQHVAEIAEHEFYDPSADAATLLTIHAAKGLEFAHVFLLGAEEGILPHKNRDDMAEEKRLFYVAATRAKQNLDILHAKTRAGQPAELSRFVRDIPESILPRSIDPNIAEQTRQAEKRRQKRAQTSLF